MPHDEQNGPIVLVADDDPAARYLLTATLTGEGYTVVEAEDGHQAVRAVADVRPDIVLMDVEMPGLDGYQACAAIRRSCEGRDLPIVMVTGREDSESVDRAFEMGATDFIAKPINWHLINHRLRYILRGARNLRALHFLAYFDALSKLPNRVSFVEQLQNALTDAEATNGQPTVLYFNLNRFKRINDTLGAAIGDAVLKEVANRVSECLAELIDDRGAGDESASWCLARLGGDEFAVLLQNPDIGPDVISVGEQIRAAVASPLTLGGHEFVITASVGVSVYPSHGADAEALIKHATLARDEARRAGDVACRFYQQSMNANAIESLDLENDLRRALEDNELRIEYQPKYCTDSMQICGAEALLRWTHPERGEIPPDTFISIAEDSGLIGDIGHWVAENVCQQIAAWQYFGHSTGRIAINVSGHEFGNGDVVDRMISAVRRAGISTSDIQLEITENVLISDIRSVLKALYALRENGFSIAVDDFGTGYSSLRYLQKLPIDELKIDRSFVLDVEKNTDSRSICSAIIALAKSLGLAVVGEGVENAWQAQFLKRLQCDFMQGFLLGRPMPPDQFVKLEFTQDRRDAVVVPFG